MNSNKQLQFLQDRAPLVQLVQRAGWATLERSSQVGLRPFKGGGGRSCRVLIAHVGRGGVPFCGLLKMPAYVCRCRNILPEIE